MNGGDASVIVINTETNAAAGTIKLQDASYPHHIYLSVAGRPNPRFSMQAGVVA